MSWAATSSIFLHNENVIFTYDGFDADNRADVRFIITNWSLRAIYSDPRFLSHNATLPLATVTDVEKVGGKKRGGWYGIEVKFSTCARLRIAFDRKKDERPKFFKSLTAAIKDRLSFSLNMWTSSDAWRCRLQEMSHWDLVDNDFCPTYPPRLFVPPGCSVDLIKSCSEYRTRKRVPFLSFLHQENGAPLLRSSQPRTGLTNSASTPDQEFIRLFRGERKLAILDCRPKLNAVANQFTGGGYESVEHYDNSSFKFLNIPNIHKVRECYLAMVKGISKGQKGASKGWGALVLQLIEGGRTAVKKLNKNEATLVHCTDGWDRTAQVAGLAQIIMDPFTRTIEGFKQLVQKEWCDAGHMFAMRNCHEPHGHMDQSAPIFAQFIDAVFQLLCASASEFEYNEVFLGFVLFHSYSQLYGDFLGNSYKERTEIARPPSLWDCLNDAAFKERFVNPNYSSTVSEITSDIKTYRYSEVIAAVPLFGSCDFVPMLQTEPSVRVATLEQVQSLIPPDSEPLPVDEYEMEVQLSRLEPPAEQVSDPGESTDSTPQ